MTTPLNEQAVEAAYGIAGRAAGEAALEHGRDGGRMRTATDAFLLSRIARAVVDALLAEQGKGMDVDSQIIADQERRIARFRAEIELLCHHDEQIYELIAKRFNPPDDDSSTPYTAIERVADFVESLPCTCTPEQIEDWDACDRCRAVGRIGDQPVAR